MMIIDSKWYLTHLFFTTTLLSVTSNRLYRNLLTLLSLLVFPSLCLFYPILCFSLLLFVRRSVIKHGFCLHQGHRKWLQCQRDRRPNLRGFCVVMAVDPPVSCLAELHTHTHTHCHLLADIQIESILEVELRI